MTWSWNLYSFCLILWSLFIFNQTNLMIHRRGQKLKLFFDQRNIVLLEQLFVEFSKFTSSNSSSKHLTSSIFDRNTLNKSLRLSGDNNQSVKLILVFICCYNDFLGYIRNEIIEPFQGFLFCEHFTVLLLLNEFKSMRVLGSHSILEKQSQQLNWFERHVSFDQFLCELMISQNGLSIEFKPESILIDIAQSFTNEFLCLIRANYFLS